MGLEKVVERNWQEGDGRMEKLQGVRPCIDSTVFDTISGTQPQVAILNYSHYRHVDKNIQYKINSV